MTDGRPLRVLFLAPQPFFEVRGTPLAVRAMVEALASLGHQIDMLTYAQGEDIPLAGVRHRRSLALPVGRVGPGASLAKLALDVPFVLHAAVLMARRRYDVVHAVEEAAHLAAPLARLLRLPLVMDVDSAIPDQLRDSRFARRGPLLWAAEALERHAFRHSAAVVTVCASLTERARRHAAGASVFQIEDPPLVDGTEAVLPERLKALRAALGLERGPVVLYTGNFEPYQGVPLLVEAAALVPEARFLFVGGEPAHVAEASALASRVGAAARCVFCGPRPTSELPEFLALADVVVSPRLLGANTPFKVYTYLAAGRPLVATRLPTHTQLLDDETAVLTEPTVEGLAAGIRVALAGPAASGARARAARERVRRHYSRERFLEKVREAYASLARRAGAGPVY